MLYIGDYLKILFDDGVINFGEYFKSKREKILN